MDEKPEEYRTGSATVSVWHDRIRIAKYGIGAIWQGGAIGGHDEFPISAITAIDWRDAGVLQEGSIEFVILGGTHHGNKNIPFKRRHQGQMERLREHVEALRRGYSTAAGAAAAAPDGASNSFGPRGDQVRASEMPGEGGVILEAEGAGGHLWLYEDRVRIKHFGLRGMLTKGVLKGDKEISLHQISAVQWRTPGNLWLGHIQFSFLGGSSDARHAHSDENAVMFYPNQEPAFRAIKEEIDRQLNALRQPNVARPTTADADIPGQIRKLAELRDAGILSTEEFEVKKGELLARM